MSKVSNDFEFRDIHNVDLLIIAGEHSGDQHAANMVAGMMKACPNIKIAAFGGPKLEASGAELIFDMTGFSVVGLYEVLKNFFFFSNLLRNVFNWIKRCAPKAICFVDYPGFNLKLSQMLFDAGLSNKSGGRTKLLYYISPQVWAWKAARKYKMAKFIDELAVIFPFEKQCFDGTGLPTTFVGHPIVSNNSQQAITYDKNGPILLCPGSRHGAIKRIFPVLLKSFSHITKERPGVMASVIYPSDDILALLRGILLKKFKNIACHVSFSHAASKICASGVIMSSGTMSLMCCLAGIPGAIVYKAHPITYAIGRMVAKIKYLGIANIVLGKCVWKEFLQNRCKPASIAKYVLRCTESERSIERFRKAAEELKNALSQTSEMTAEEWALSAING